MPKNDLNVTLKGIDELLFSIEEQRQEEKREQVQQIPIDELHPFTNHPFKVVDDEAMTRTVESIAQFGVLAPLIARPRPDGDGYEIISGHRRQFAAKMAGLETLPVIVRDMDDDAATILMVDSNLQREHISPSERAFAYKMKLDALKNQGARSDLTSRQVVGKLEAADVIGKATDESGRQVQRYVRLTNLIPELLNMVDEKMISFNPAVELSYLSPEQQQEMIKAMDDLTMYDELQLDTLGDKKTALFLIMSDTDSTFNFLISMVYTQLFNLLCDKADDVYGGKLPIHVRCLIDECANIGQIPNLEKLVATIRSREISACLVLQAKSQLKAIYKDNADTIIGNMDSQIFLGGSEPGTLKDLSEMLGKETIDAFNTSDTRGNSPSYGTNYSKLGHELLSRDELAVMDGGKCILQLRGVRPFLSDKYDLTQHPNYKLTSDFDEKNRFDIEKYLNRKAKIHPGDEFIVVDADSLPSA